MRFSLLTKLSAFALVATNMVSADEASNLRGPVLVATSGANSVADTPGFFPSDMTEDQIAVWKERASQKRQNKRDRRRAIDNPNRSQAEEDRERGRKTSQSRSRGRDDVDPYTRNVNDDGEFGRRRNARNDVRCVVGDSGCDWQGAEQNCYDNCASTGRRGGRCSRDCFEKFERYHEIAEDEGEDRADEEYMKDYGASASKDEESVDSDRKSGSGEDVADKENTALNRRSRYADDDGRGSGSRSFGSKGVSSRSSGRRNTGRGQRDYDDYYQGTARDYRDYDNHYGDARNSDNDEYVPSDVRRRRYANCRGEWCNQSKGSQRSASEDTADKESSDLGDKEISVAEE